MSVQSHVDGSAHARSALSTVLKSYILILIMDVVSFTFLIPTAGVDYTAVSMDVSITTGSNESCPLILFTNDTIEEDCGDEVFGVNLTAVSQRVTIGNGTSLVNIADDDQPGGNSHMEQH